MKHKKIIQDFLERETTKQKIIVIYGPTGSGKTAMSIDIAKYLDTEIISTDSRQIYKGMDIGTGKITEGEKEGVLHHMLDIINPDEVYSVGEFKNQSIKHIQSLQVNNKIPILCGGTGLYIDSLIYDFDIPKVVANPALRKVLEKEAEEYGNEYLYQKLVKLDPEYAQELHPNNVQYVIRALEVKIITGESKQNFRGSKIPKYDILFLTPYTGDREYLYQRINLRVQMMFDDGLVDEVQNLRKKYSDNTPGLKSIGYTEVVDYLEGKSTLSECISNVQQHNRNYAKRQITWFRRYEEIIEKNNGK